MKILSGLLKILFIICMLISSIGKLNAQLTSVSSSGLPNIGRGEAKFADFDKDGKLDLIIIGQTGDYTSSTTGVVGIYKGNGDGTFTDVTSTWFSVAPTPVGGGILAVGDFDNDGYIDFCYAGRANSTNIIKLYHNNAGTGFTDVTTTAFAKTTAPTGVHTGSIVFGDIDGDGHLDLLIQGRTYSALTYPTSSGARSNTLQLYKNNGDGTFTVATLPNTSTASVCYGQTLWSDLDNDGDLDILYFGGGNIGGQYVNDGTGTYTLTTYTGTSNAVRGSNLVFGDFNADGKMDYLQSYISSSSTPAVAMKLAINSTTTAGTLAFTQSTPLGVVGVGGTTATTNMGMLSCADYNNDGFLDYTVQGLTGGTTPSMILYLNNGAASPTFTASPISLTGLNYGNAIWGDVNGDGTPDLLAFGYTDAAASVPQTKLYLNGTATANSAPYAPSSISATSNGSNAILSWTMPTSADDHTANAALTYNLRVGKTSGGSDVVSPMANTTNGFRNIVQLGAITTNAYTLKNLSPGTYYWSVQAIDANYQGGTWATEGTFTIVAATSAPTLQPSGVSATTSTTDPTKITLNWTNGDGYKCAIFARVGTSTTDLPTLTANTAYTAGAFGNSASQIGASDWYCVYNNSVTPSSVTSTSIAGFVPLAGYQFVVVSYNGDGTTINYLTPTSGYTVTNSDYVAPTTQIKSLTFGSTTNSSTKLSWTRGNGSSFVAFIAPYNASSVPPTPTNNNTYTANAANGSGSTLADGNTNIATPWYCIYNGNSTSVIITGLSANTTYQVVAYEYNGTQVNGASYEKYFLGTGTGNPATVATADYTAPTTQATAITATNISASAMDLSWTKGQGSSRLVFATTTTDAIPTLTDNTTYTVANTVGNWTCIYNGTGNSYSYSSLAANTGYNFVVYEYNGAPGYEKYLQTSATDNPKSFTTLLSTPIADAASGKSQIAFTANWEAVTGATGYKLDVSTDQAFTSMVTGYSNLDVALVTNYSVKDLTAGTTYYYRVRAYNAAGVSDNSNIITLNTDAAAIPIPDASIASSASSISQTGFTANWGASANASGYRLDVATDDSFNNLLASYTNIDVANVTSYAVKNLTVGTTYFYRVKAYNASGTSAASNTITLSTLKNAQTITFGALISKTYGDAAFTLGATASSLLDVSYTSSNTSVATVSGNTVTIVGAGTTTITASQAGSNTYDAATDVSQTFSVSTKQLTVTATNVSVTYGDLPTYSATLSGFISGETSSVISGSASFSSTATTPTAVGTYTIMPALGTLSATNYSFNFVNGVLTVVKKPLTVSIKDTSMILGNQVPTFKPIYTGFVYNDNESVISGSPIFQTLASTTNIAGTYSVDISNGSLSASNYSFTFISGKIVVKDKNTGVESLSGSGIKIYPNPVVDKLKVYVPDFVKGAYITCSSVTGVLLSKTLITNSSTDIDVRGLASGTYFVKIVNGKTSVVKQVIKL